MSVLYINRNKTSGFSIQRVFAPIQALNKDSVSISVPYKGTNPIRLLLNLIYVARNKKHGSIYHITGDIYYCALALPGKQTIITYHDATALLLIKRPFFQQKLFFFLWFYLPIKRARLITCISEKTREDLVGLCPWASRKIIIVEDPIGSEFRYKKKAFNKQKPIILHIGTGFNKNLPRVIEALSGISCHLRIIGAISDEIVSLLHHHQIDYSNDKNLTDEQIAIEYQKCDIVSFPSVYEGFGLPLIEGFASGRIVVSSDINPMKSLSEGAAILVNPNDVSSIRQGFLRAIEKEPQRQELIDQGLLISKKYEPCIIYNKYCELYHQI